MAIIKTEYAVYWGKTSDKGGFRKLSTAKRFAQEKANFMKKPAKIDKISFFVSPITGKTDWSQSPNYLTVKPKLKKVM